MTLTNKYLWRAIQGFTYKATKEAIINNIPFSKI
jgi:hypothetical protein